MEVNIIKVDGKPIEKLIETVSLAVGTLYKPKAIRREADAEAYKIEKIKEAEAKGMIITANAEIEIAMRAKERFVLQEVNRQINIEDIVDKAALHLKEIVSDNPVDVDWRTRFFLKAQDISNEEVKEIWAKILANEVANPGNISLRTLDVLSNLSKKEAKLFHKIAGISFFGRSVLKISNEPSFDEFGITFDDLLTLKSIGLIHNSDSIGIVYKRNLQIQGTLMAFGNKTLLMNKEGHDEYLFNQVCFTSTAEELVRTLDIEYDYAYLDYFISEKTKEGYLFKEIKDGDYIRWD